MLLNSDTNHIALTFTIKVDLNFKLTTKLTHLVWTQSIGFPTYCRVVTAIENVTNSMTVAFVCNRKTAESIFTWFICSFQDDFVETWSYFFFTKFVFFNQIEDDVFFYFLYKRWLKTIGRLRWLWKLCWL